MVIVVTISAPSTAEVGTSFKVSGTVRDDGEYLSGAAVSIYVDNVYVTGDTTDINGYYSKNIAISDVGVYTLKATAVGASATRSIIIFYIPYVSSVTISAPSSVETGQNFTISGQVKDQYGNGYGGVTVNLYRNDSPFASIFADSSGYYSRSTSISTAGTYTLKAVADSKQATRSITVSTPTPTQVGSVTVNAPPTVNKNVLFTISGVVKDQYGAVMGGVSVKLYDNGTYFATVTTSSFGTYSKIYSIGTTGTHELAATADTKVAYININITEPPVEPPPCTNPFPWATDPEGPYEGETVNFIEVYRNWGIWYITGPGVYGITDPYCVDQNLFFGTVQACRNKIDDLIGVGIPTTTTLSAPGSIGVNEKFMISGILYETESGTPIPKQPINHSYNGRSLGGSTTGVDGDYLKEVSIPESGVWTIKSEFPGTPGYAASTSVADTMVAASPLKAAITIAGSAATGLALIIYSLS